MWTAVGAGATFLVVYTFTPGPLDTFPFITNPVGIGGTVGHILGMLGNIGLVVLLIALLASAGSLILRLRRAKGVERQQLKWFVYAATLATIGAVVALAGANVFASELINVIGYWEGQLALAALPVFTGIAILRYRLYDIDIIINRTLVYGSLTALLALVYLGGVTATQAIFRTLTGEQEQPQLAIVVSTLIIAALFNPLRRGIQSFIDRRFYHSKYDARKTPRSFLGSAQGRDGPECAERRPGRGGKGDDATRTRLAVVASRYAPEGRAGSLVAPYSPNCLE